MRRHSPTVRAGNRAAPDIEFVNKYPPSWMKKVGFPSFSLILLMLPLKGLGSLTPKNGPNNRRI